MRKEIVVVVGTRPEAIKMAPLIKKLYAVDLYDVIVLSTGQHLEMLDEVFRLFQIEPDFNLRLMRKGQSLDQLSSRVLSGVGDLLDKIKPDLVLVHGDTTTASFAALAAFYRNIKVGHVEAGLRSFDMRQPFPEEYNRKMISSISNYHFAPTDKAMKNLINEGINHDSIFVTGNTVIDAVLSMQENEPKANKNRVLITIHRRENLGDNIINICNCVKDLAYDDSSIEFVFPMHPNPIVRQKVTDILGKVANVQLTEPLGYRDFVKTMCSSFLILSDSGGIQEEAPSLDIPVLVLRNVTERPEVLETGIVHLVGANVELIKKLYHFYKLNQNVKAKIHPFGKGDASDKIVNAIK